MEVEKYCEKSKQQRERRIQNIGETLQRIELKHREGTLRELRKFHEESEVSEKLFWESSMNWLLAKEKEDQKKFSTDLAIYKEKNLGRYLKIGNSFEKELEEYITLQELVFQSFDSKLLEFFKNIKPLKGFIKVIQEKLVDGLEQVEEQNKKD